MVPFKEYRMSMFQVVSLSGIVMGCMLLAFYLGVYFGNKIGFENAMNESRENLAKVPIDLSDTGKDDVDEKTVNQVYEKLKKDSLNEDFDNDLPTLAKIAEDINQNEDNGNNDKGDKINILGNDEVPDVLGGNKKAIGEYVEDINFADGDDGQKVKKDIIKGSDEDKEDVALVVDGVDTESEDIKAEIKDVKKKIDEHLEKEKDVNKDDIKPVLPKIDSPKEQKLIDEKEASIKIVAKDNKIIEVQRPNGNNLKLPVNQDGKAKVEKIETIAINENDTKIKLEPTNVIVPNNDIKRPEVQHLNIQEKPSNPNTQSGILPKLPSGNSVNSVPGNNLPNNNNQADINRPIGYQGAINQGNQGEVNVPTASSTSHIPRGFYVQIAATTNEGEAALLSRKVRESGFKVVVEQSVVGGSRYYRVLAGPEDTREHATRMVDQIRREPYINSQPFVRDVK